MSAEYQNKPAFLANPEAQQLIFGSPSEWFARLKADIHRLYQDPAYLEHRQRTYDGDGEDTVAKRIHNVALGIEEILRGKVNHAYATWDLPHGLQYSEQLEEELCSFQRLMLAEGIAPRGVDWYTELPQDAHTLLYLLCATPCYAKDLPKYAERYGFDLDVALTALRGLDILGEGDVVYLKVRFHPTHPITEYSRKKFPTLFREA